MFGKCLNEKCRFIITAAILMAAIGPFASAVQTYDVAAFYWPSLHYDERWATFFPDGSQGEWESIRNAKPKWEGHYQPRVPAWGYLMDNDPAAMEKKIEAATSHGVNVMLFDWYWFENKPFLESALNDGFLKAKNVDKMKFYLMWANHDAKTTWDIRRSHVREVIWPGSVDLPTFKIVVARVIKKYFSHPSYYKIDGKPVFAIYDMNNLIKGLGGVQQTVAALDYFRSEVKKAGFPGLHFQMIYWGKVPKIDDSGFASEKGTTANTVKTFKVDSLTNYQFAHLARPVGDYIPWADKAIANWPRWSRQFNAPYFPHVSIGWDNNARFKEIRGAITENANPETFKRYLLKAKAYVDAHPDQPKLITINAWNEWVEGSYLEPDERFGMQYLEAVRDVFVSGVVTANAEEAAPPSKKIKVFILSGQSNMVGWGDSTKLPNDLRKGNDRVLMFENDEWQPLRPHAPALPIQRPYGLTEFHFGPEIAFGHELAKAFPDETIGIIKYASGGSSILAWKPNWSKADADRIGQGGRGSLYKALMDKVKQAQAKREIEIVGFIWQQGGRDMTKVDVAKEYLDNLKSLVAAVRRDTGASDLQFIYGSPRREGDPDDLSDFVPELTKGRVAAQWVVKAQFDAQKAIPHSKMVIVRNIESHPKNPHYNTAGQMLLGKLFAEAFLETQRQASVPVDDHAVGEGKAVQGDPYSFLSKAKVDKKIIPERLPGYLLFKENIVYTLGADTKLRDLDILYHVDHKTIKRPAILVIHGGGWRGGDKIRGHEIMAIYALQGYVTVSVNYRLAPDSVAPAQVHDVKLSVRWLRANAEKYGIDPNRIGCTGGSAGGHLTAMVAVTKPSDDLEGPFLSGYSSAVQAAMPLSGVFDLRGSEKRFIDPFLGGPFGRRKPGLSEKMSPTWLLRPERARTIPPMLVVHSDNEMVPVDQVEGFMDGLKRIGRNDPLVLLPGKEHGHSLIQVKAVREAADKFFGEYLKPQPPGSKE